MFSEIKKSEGLSCLYLFLHWDERGAAGVPPCIPRGDPAQGRSVTFLPGLGVFGPGKLLLTKNKFSAWLN